MGIYPFISFAILHKKKRAFFLILATKAQMTSSFICSELFFEQHFSLSVQLLNHK